VAIPFPVFSEGPKKGARLKAIDADMEPLTAFYYYD